MAVAPGEVRVVCFTSSDRACVIKLCNLECALSSKFLTAPAKGKVDTTAETRLNRRGRSLQNQRLRFHLHLLRIKPLNSSSDSDEDMTYYYQEHEEFGESD